MAPGNTAEEVGVMVRRYSAWPAPVSATASCACKQEHKAWLPRLYVVGFISFTSTRTHQESLGLSAVAFGCVCRMYTMTASH